MSTLSIFGRLSAVVISFYIYRVARRQTFQKRRLVVIETCRALKTSHKIGVIDACELFGSLVSQVGSHDEPLYAMVYRAVLYIRIKLCRSTVDPILILQSTIGGVQFLAYAASQTNLDQGAALIRQNIQFYTDNSGLDVPLEDLKHVLATVQRRLVETRACGQTIRTSFHCGYVKLEYSNGKVMEGTLREFYLNNVNV